MAAAAGMKTGIMKRKLIFFKAVLGFLNIVCMVLMWAFMESFTLHVQAASAVLVSEDAAVYEQADETSRQVGNLVEGSTFEYTGDVTAADGTVWHQITTSSGVKGYIRGDMEIREEETAVEEQEGEEEALAEVQGEEEADLAEDENTPVENGNELTEGEENMGEASEADSGENEELEADNTVAAVINMQNNQPKKYVLNPSGKVKERETFAAADIDVQNVKRRAGVDITLFTGIAVVLICAVISYTCLKRMRMLKAETDSREIQDADRNNLHKKKDKKKRIQKRKAKKGARMLKEKSKRL